MIMISLVQSVSPADLHVRAQLCMKCRENVMASVQCIIT